MADETVITKFIVKPLKEIFQRVVLGFLFLQGKQPSLNRICLKECNVSCCLLLEIKVCFFASQSPIEKMQVYVNTTNVDDYLVESISQPATDPNTTNTKNRATLFDT